MLDLVNINKIYNQGLITEACLFRDFNLHVDTGEFVSIVGSNGSGKTSMLNIICGSIPVEGGQVLIDGHDITRSPEHRRYTHIGRIFQDPAMGTCPDLTMLENLSLADNKGKPFNLGRAVSRQREEFFKEQLASLQLGLEDKLHVKMGSLSGGQRQAVALLMVTLSPLDFLILDEHTAALDPHTAEVIMQLTDRIVREKKLTAMMVTHNLRYAVEYGSRLLMMDRGRVIMDKSGKEKQDLQVDDILDVFTHISIECGN